MASLLIMNLALAGCPLAWNRVAINETITPEDVAFIIPGKTTLTDIVAKLGTPNEITAPDNGIAPSSRVKRRPEILDRSTDAIPDSHPGAVARYRFLDVKRFRVNFTWALQFFLSAPGVPNDVVFQGVGAGTDEFLVVFDPNWVVRYHAFATHAGATQYRHWPFDLEPPDDNQVVSF